MTAPIRCMVIVDKDGDPECAVAPGVGLAVDEARGERLVSMVEEAALTEALAQVAALREALGDALTAGIELGTADPAWAVRAQSVLRDTEPAARAWEREVFRKGMEWWFHSSTFVVPGDVTDADIDAALDAARGRAK